MKLWKYFENFEKKSRKTRFSTLLFHFSLMFLCFIVLEYDKQFLKQNRMEYKTDKKYFQISRQFLLFIDLEVIVSTYGTPFKIK